MEAGDDPVIGEPERVVRVVVECVNGGFGSSLFLLAVK
jgi:hypothetical protein